MTRAQAPGTGPADDGTLIKRWRASDTSAEQIAAELAAKITSGQIRQWDELPPRAELASKHNVSQRTVTRANSLLADHGFLTLAGGRYYVT